MPRTDATNNDKLTKFTYSALDKVVKGAKADHETSVACYYQNYKRIIIFRHIFNALLRLS